MPDERSDPTRPPAPADRVAAWALRAVAALAAACAVASLSWPFGWDQGIFAWIGDVIDRGGMPYRDAWDMKGPLVYCVYAVAQAVFGAHTWAIRALDLVFVAAACFALARIARGFAGRRTAIWTAVLFALWYASGTYWHTAQPDGWAGFLVLGAMSALLAAGDRVRFPQALLAGACVGLTVLVKPFYGAFLAIVLLHLVLHLRGTPRLLGASVAAALVGFVLPIAAAAAWLSHRGALGDYIDVAIRYPASLYTGGSTSTSGGRVRGVVEFVRSGHVAVAAIAPAAFGFVHLMRTSRRSALVIAAWAATAFAGVVAQGRFFEYHWLPVHAPIAVLAAVGLHAALTASRDAARGLAVSVFALLVLHACIHPVFETARWAGWAAGRTDTTAYYDGFGIPGADRRAALHIEARSAPDDEIAMWGWNTAIAHMSRRRVATRFGFSMPLMMGGESPTRAAYRAEFMEGVRKRPPLYVVDAPQSETLLGARFDLSDFPEFAEFVRTRYAEEARFGELRVLRLSGTGSRR